METKEWTTITHVAIGLWIEIAKLDDLFLFALQVIEKLTKYEKYKNNFASYMKIFRKKFHYTYSVQHISSPDLFCSLPTEKKHVFCCNINV